MTRLISSSHHYLLGTLGVPAIFQAWGFRAVKPGASPVLTERTLQWGRQTVKTAHTSAMVSVSDELAEEGWFRVRG